MKFLVGKIGQKIIFNRESEKCNRSNTNGNVGTYCLFKLLFECNKNDEFYVISDNDLDELKDKWSNVYDYKDKKYDDLDKYDKMFILAGLKEYENDTRFLDIINNASARYILLADDPRCLESTSEDSRITRLPDVIASQFYDRHYMFRSKSYKVNYVRLERSICYKAKRVKNKKERNIIAIANTSGDKYNRLGILLGLIKDIDIEVYGRLTEDEVKLFDGKHKGEIKYNEMQAILSSSIASLLIPIRKGWLTTKYIECLLNNVCPIFYYHYNTSLLECKDLMIVSNKKELEDTIEKLSTIDIQKKIDGWYAKMVKPFEDGKMLSKEIINL